MDLDNIEKQLDSSSSQEEAAEQLGGSLTAGEDHLLSEDRVESIVVTYICSKCKAVDHDKVRDGEPVAPAINCWKCGAGKGVELKNMLASRIGMFAQPLGNKQPQLV